MAFSQSFSLSYPNGCASIRVTDNTTYGDGSSNSQPPLSALTFKVVTVRNALTQAVLGTTTTYDPSQIVFDFGISGGLSTLLLQVDLFHAFSDPYGSFGRNLQAVNTCFLS